MLIDLEDQDYLCRSQKGINRPIMRITACLILKELQEQFGLGNIGTHTLRKTFGYHFYTQFKVVVALQKIFNHKNQRETLVYIGVQ
ncbi:tyrosine-type recombinase/integrase [Listeria booriae]|uniref:tyrosine-type recombinase/integrase n=1 Tax=Listeria booriae TaxID=1552123 RepID=UPI0021AB4EC0|nr:tyrosine-type recombinase/integrase [Listeria booriae]